MHNMYRTLLGDELKSMLSPSRTVLLGLSWQGVLHLVRLLQCLPAAVRQHFLLTCLEGRYLYSYYLILLTSTTLFQSWSVGQGT